MVAWCPSDSNDGELVQVVFDDKSASTTLTVGEFNQCRAAYIALHPYDRSISEEAKERRENERRERGVGRGGREVRGGRGGRSIGRGAIDQVRHNPPQLAEVPLLPPTNQRAAQTSAVRELPAGGAVAPTIVSSAALSTIAGRGGRGGRSIGRGAIDPVHQNPPQFAEVPLLPPTNQLAVQASLAQEEQAAIVAHTIRVVGEGPHPPTGKRKRREVFGNEEMCMCSCMKIYDTTDMSNCKGMNCSNRIRRSCVPLNWLCSICNEL